MRSESPILDDPHGRVSKSERHSHWFKVLGAIAGSLLMLCITLSGSLLASQGTQTLQTAKATEKPLTNSDILDMLSAGVSDEVVLAKIAGSVCEFDTSPAALKRLKAAKVPDAVALAMVRAPSGSQGQELTNAEPSAPARIDCKHTDPVSVYSAPQIQQTSPDSDSAVLFKVNCGDRITLLNPDDKQSWLKIRTADGQVGYILYVLVSREQSAGTAQEGHATSDPRQKASDDLEDCRTTSQNEYDSKMNAVGTMALTPMMRVVASNRLKQNLDAELRQCRSQYESRLKGIDAK